MKSISILFFSFLFLCGCRKAVENALENAVLNSMTNGQWAITSFIENGSDITAGFSTYKFQYHTNKTVDAIKNGVIEYTGKWDGSTVDKTTWADFPGAIEPVTLLNGTWHITNNTLSYVKAYQTVGSTTKTFRLDKQ